MAPLTETKGTVKLVNELGGVLGVWKPWDVTSNDISMAKHRNGNILWDLWRTSSSERFLVGGWTTPSETYEFVSWDDEIPNWIET